jgi:NAD(P)-dependent dehydrogenase (short-subunit alcohol dehydrogenase family)
LRAGCHNIVQEAIAQIYGEVGSGDGVGVAEFMALNLASLESVQRFAADFKSRGLPLHVLSEFSTAPVFARALTPHLRWCAVAVANAGIMMVPHALIDGIESTMAVNHFGHVLLTFELLDVLEKSQPSRIVLTASDAHLRALSGGYHALGCHQSASLSPWPGRCMWRVAAGIPLVADASGVLVQATSDKAVYEPFVAYAETKLANFLFGRWLAKRLAATQVAGRAPE